jgi:hypothetical protein
VPEDDSLTSKSFSKDLQHLLSCAKLLTTTDLQTLATYQLENTVERSADADLLTGYHFTDGCRRIIVLEGLADRAMRLIFEVYRLSALQAPVRGLNVGKNAAEAD